MTIDFRFYFSLFLLRIHYFLIAFGLFGGIGLTLAFVLPPVFRAEAVLIVESQQMPSDLAETTVQIEASEQLQIIQQRILTRARLVDMAREQGVYDARGESPALLLPADELVDDMRRRITIETTGGTVSRGPAQATIVRVSFSAPTAAMSANVTNELVTQLLAENVAIRTGVAGQTLQFFVDEVARLDQELANRGAEILAFQEKNLNALPDSLDLRRSQQAAAQERLNEFDLQLSVLESRRAGIVDLYAATGQVSAAPDASLSPEQQQLQAQRDELSGLLSVLSPENPRVRLLQAQIATLERTVAAQAGLVPEVGANGEAPSSYDIQLADIDSQLAFIKEQRNEIETMMGLLAQSIEATPGNANTLDTLQRDYEAVRAQYDLAVSNKARAETGDTIEALAKGQRISVIEQAVAPSEPESPNRLMLALAGLMGGIVAGLALLVVVESLGSAIRRPVDITNKLGIAPLGTIRLMRTRWEIVRRRAIIAGSLTFVIVGLPTFLWIVHTQITPLDTLIRGLLGPFGQG